MDVDAFDEEDPRRHRQVEAMAGYGIPVAEIAKVLQVDREVLLRDYKVELESAATRANARVAENLFRKATGEGRESVIAAIFWLKTRAGWRETTNHEISGREGGPVTLARRIIVSPNETDESVASPPQVIDHER